jgi:hypothetical protein
MIQMPLVPKGSPPDQVIDFISGAIGLLVGVVFIGDAIRGIWRTGFAGGSRTYPSSWYLRVISFCLGGVALGLGVEVLLRAFGIGWP